RLAQNWGVSVDVTWEMGDFDRDGVVGPADASILAANWHYGLADPFGSDITDLLDSLNTAVPEPSTLALLILGGLGLSLCRRGIRQS
ncbi:MAG: PEP-CTERM sorting domain-containing protein, partial [Pirellulales bacterium]|nr:PEP-CTERM sorting domain-containing protein [Pirellulales bacterium]